MPDVPAKDVIAAALYEHNWASPDCPEAEPPRDETECCASVVLDALKAAGYVVVQLPEPGEFSYDSDDVWMNNDGDIVDAAGDCYGRPADAAAFAVALLAAAVSGANK